MEKVTEVNATNDANTGPAVISRTIVSVGEREREADGVPVSHLQNKSDQKEPTTVVTDKLFAREGLTQWQLDSGFTDSFRGKEYMKTIKTCY